MKVACKFLKKILKVILFVFVLQIALIVLMKFVPVYCTSVMICDSITNLFQKGEWKAIHHHWVPLKKINPTLIRMVLTSEDSNFFSHNGFDFESIKQAYKLNKEKGRIVRGGSTISQQTAKNVFLYKKRSYIRKILEAYYTCMIELIWGKKRILEVYLNSIEMGENIYGVESCSRIIFGRSASTLNTEQCAKIVSQLPTGGKECKITDELYNWIMKQYLFKELPNELLQKELPKKKR